MTWHRNYVAFIEQTWTWKSSPLVYCNGLYLSGLLHSVWEDLEASGGEEVGGGIGMGNTCKSMADSFQCMTKPTTIKLKKKRKEKSASLKKGKKKKQPMWLEFLSPGKRSSMQDWWKINDGHLVEPFRAHQNFVLSFKCLCKPWKWVRLFSINFSVSRARDKFIF